MAAKRTRQRTTVTFSVEFQLPVGTSIEKGRRVLLEHVASAMPIGQDFDPRTVKVKLLSRHVDYTERGTSTPDS